jgi:NADPH:quinone reductase-like Zn-dependent oxidoreductase
VSFGSFLEPGTGAFSEYCRVPGGRAIKIPESMSFNEATTLGASSTTAVCGLYDLLKLPEPIQPESDTPILVWSGASTSLLMN